MQPTVALLVAVLAASAALAPAAAAQHGNGLYEPFPHAAVSERAKRFVEGLAFPKTAATTRLSDKQLARGAFVDPHPSGLPGAGPLAPTGAGAASARAGVGDGGSSSLAPATQIALVLLAIVALPVLAGRRPRRRVAAV